MISMNAKKGKKASFQYIYYDACALDSDKYLYSEIISTRGFRGIASHLSLGEAYGNCFTKTKRARESFAVLIEKLVENKFLSIVGNDSVDAVLKLVRETFPALSVTDAVHLATALKKGCSVFKTGDRDFCGLNKHAVNELGKKYSIEAFRIENINK